MAKWRKTGATEQYPESPRYPIAPWKLPESRCPVCSAVLNAASDPRPKRGKPAVLREGDLSTCSECLATLQFDAELRPVRVTPERLAELVREQPGLKDELRAAKGAALAYRKGVKP